MGWLRGMGWASGVVVLAAVWVAALAAWPSAVIDRGPDGSTRLSPFPIALTAFDPLVWECARNSLAVASAVAVGSIFLGVGLTLAAGRARPWGRLLLGSSAWVAMAAGPLLVAPGVALILGGPAGWEWLAARSILGISAEGLVRWSALGWVGLAVGVPLVAMATASAMGRVDPSWAEAARAAGASRRRAWRDVVWPALRPEAARAGSAAFTIALVEPAGPMVLGLRRTLAVQMVEAAWRLDEPTRAATLAVLATAIAIVGRLAIGRWGGPSPVPQASEPPRASPPPPAGRALAFASGLVLLAWSAMAIGPVVALVGKAVEGGRGAGVGLGGWSAAARGWASDPEARAWAVNSATTAGLAVGLDLIVLAGLVGGGPRVLGPAIRSAARAIEVIPPMAVGVGALSVPWLLGALADPSGDGPGRWLRAAALELSPARSPGLLLVVALAAIRLPMLARAAELARARDRPVMADAARLLGSSRGDASRMGEGRRLGAVPARPAVLAMALASTALAPALILAPSPERRTLAPAAVGFLLEGGPIDPRASGPIAAVLVVNLAGFAVASRGRMGSIGAWYRG